MRKTELLHLHSLFGLLARHLEREGAVDGLPEPYESMDVRPSHAHRSKERHREAVLALASGIANELAANSKYTAESEGASAVAAEGDKPQ